MATETNQFADLDLLPVVPCPRSDNPYAPPALVELGFWDKTLMRRMIRAAAFIGAWFLVMDAVAMAQFLRFNAGQTVHMTAFQMLEAFFAGWNF